jgi:hypothetical protein
VMMCESAGSAPVLGVVQPSAAPAAAISNGLRHPLIPFPEGATR